MDIHETSDCCSRSAGGSDLTNGEERMEGAGRGEMAETAAITGENSLKEDTNRPGFDEEGRRPSDNEGTESKEDQPGCCLPQNMDVKTFSSIGNDDPGSEHAPLKTVHPALVVPGIGDDEMDDLDLVNEDSSQEAARSPTASPVVLVQNNVPHDVLNRLGLDMGNVLPAPKGQDEIQISMRRHDVPMSRPAAESEIIQGFSLKVASCPGVLRREPNKDSYANLHSGGITTVDPQPEQQTRDHSRERAEQQIASCPVVLRREPNKNSDANLHSDGITTVDPQPEQQTRNRSRERADQQVVSSVVFLLPGESEKSASKPPVTPTKAPEVKVRQQHCDRAESPISGNQPFQQDHLTQEREGPGNKRDWSICCAGASLNDENIRSFTTQQSQMTQVEESPCASPASEEQLSKVESGSLDDQYQAEDRPNSDADELLEARNEDENQNSSRRTADVMASTTPSVAVEIVEDASQPPLEPARALEVDVRREDCVNTARAGSSVSHRVGCRDERNEISDREEVLQANPEIASVQNQLRSFFNNHFSLRTISNHAINLQRTSVLPCATQIYSRLLDEPPEISNLDSMRNISAHFTNRVMRTTIIPRARYVYTDYLQAQEQNAEKRNMNPTQNCNALHIPNPGICVNSDSVNRSSNNIEEENDEGEDQNINIPNFYTVRERNDRVEAEPDIPEICLVCHEFVGEHECQFAQHLTHAFVDNVMEMEGHAFNDFSFSLQHPTSDFVDDGMEMEV